MHKIYLEKRCMIICSPDEQALADPNSVELHLGDNPDITALVDMFETSATLARISIPPGCGTCPKAIRKQERTSA